MGWSAGLLLAAAAYCFVVSSFLQHAVKGGVVSDATFGSTYRRGDTAEYMVYIIAVLLLLLL